MRGQLNHDPRFDAYGERVAGLPMEPLRVSVVTVTPVASNDPVAFDGLLAYAMVTEALAGQSFPEAPGIFWQPLPLKMEREVDGLPLWATTHFQPENLAKGMSHIHRRTADNPYEMPALQASLGNKRLRRFPNQQAGQYMDFRVPERRNVASRWTATCVGNRAEIERLLAYVQHFGRAPKRGCGFIQEWRVEPLGGEFSLYDADGEPLRPIPIEWDAGVGSLQGFTSPYWLKDGWRMCLDYKQARLM